MTSATNLIMLLTDVRSLENVALARIEVLLFASTFFKLSLIFSHCSQIFIFSRFVLQKFAIVVMEKKHLSVELRDSTEVYYGGDTITGDIVLDNDEALEATCKLSILFIC